MARQLAFPRLIGLGVRELHDQRVTGPREMGEENVGRVAGATHEVPAERHVAMRKQVVGAVRAEQEKGQGAVQRKLHGGFCPR